MKIPSSLAPICMVTIEMGPGSQRSLHAAKLIKSGQFSKTTLTLALPLHAGADRAAARRFFRNQEIIHIGDPGILDCLEALGCAAQAHDLLKLLSLLPSVDKAYDLKDVAERHGLPPRLRESARTSGKARLTMMQSLWVSLLRPSLAHLVRAAPARPPRAIDQIPSPATQPPLPSPPIPDMAPPPCGWRTSRWGIEEARDCALRFTRGATLDQLARLIRRSPRSIHARLYADGIISGR